MPKSHLSSESIIEDMRKACTKYKDHLEKEESKLLFQEVKKYIERNIKNTIISEMKKNFLEVNMFLLSKKERFLLIYWI